MANSKKSGGNWERDVCKFLSKWINGTGKPYVFWRSGGSGSVFTMSEGKAGEEFSGDIYAVREEGTPLTNIFSIECKSGYNEASLNKFLKYNKSDPIKDFWIQCVDDAEKSNKYPMLIFKKKGYPTPWCGISYNIKKQINKYVKDIRNVCLSWDKQSNLPDIYFFEMYEFFNTLKLEIIEKLK